VDTRATPLLAAAAAQGQRPFLLELKQAVGRGLKSTTSSGDVLGKTRDALDQAEQYSRNLRSNALWTDHEVFVIVVYDGPARYKVDRSDVRLVYIGNEVPPATPPEVLTV
jgi:hypothetical protein